MQVMLVQAVLGVAVLAAGVKAENIGARPTGSQPDIAFGAGISAFYAGDYQLARQYFHQACEMSKCAFHAYYLALAEDRLGNSIAFNHALLRGLEIEAKSSASPKVLGTDFSRVQGKTRIWLENERTRIFSGEQPTSERDYFTSLKNFRGKPQVNSAAPSHVSKIPVGGETQRPSGPNYSLQLDHKKRVAMLNGKEILLTPSELRILDLFLKKAGHIYAYSEIAKLADVAESGLSTHLSNLRKKFDQAVPGSSDLLETKRGVGYGIKSPSGPSTI